MWLFKLLEAKDDVRLHGNCSWISIKCYTSACPSIAFVSLYFFIICFFHNVVSEFHNVWYSWGALFVPSPVKVIGQYGGQVDDSYSNRITHVLCEHQKSDVFQLVTNTCWICLVEPAVVNSFECTHIILLNVLRSFSDSSYCMIFAYDVKWRKLCF